MRKFIIPVIIMFLASISVCAAEVILEETCLVRAPGNAQQNLTKYGRGRPADIKHIALDVSVDFETESVEGKATTTLTPIGEPLSEIVLDAVGLDIAGVKTSEGAELDFEVTLDKLKVFLPSPVALDKDFTFVVEYRVERPTKGLYFRTERMGYKPEETSVWSQGEPEEAHHWFPCFDYPNDRATTEIRATVPEGYVALSNGKLLNKTSKTGTVTYHYRESVPHVSYLVCLVVGKYVEIKDSHKDIPVTYHVFPGFEDEALMAMSKTPKMMQFYDDYIGVPYPYEKYGQVVVVDFTFGGMENTSITTLTERTLHDEAAHLTHSSDSLVAHELVHQWWGDLLTCRDWSHLWLNEGFATYFDALFQEYDLGEDAFNYEMLKNMRQILEGDKGDNRAPVVRTKYDEPISLFDFRSYKKGGRILHMLRRELGDDMFKRVINVYCTRYQGKVVETTDLLRTVEEVSGRGMEQFFDQWLYHGGYPELDVSYDWDNKAKLATVTVTQTQTVDAKTPIFAFTTDIAFHGKRKSHVEKVTIDKKIQSFQVALPSRPQYVRFDPHGDILKTMVFNKPKAMLLTQLKKDKTAIGRIEAIEALKKIDKSDVVAALEKTLREDEFWGVKAEAAKALGEIENGLAVKVLLRALDLKDARARLPVVQALATKDTDKAKEALLQIAKKDESPYVTQAAIRGLGKLDHKEAIEVVTDALDRDSHNEVIRTSALGALASLKAEDSLETILEHISPDTSRQVRYSAISTLGELGKDLEDNEEVRNALTALLDEHSRRIRRSAINALGVLGDKETVDALEHLAYISKDDDEKKNITRVIKKIHSEKEQSAEVKELRSELEELKSSKNDLEKRLDALEKQTKPKRRRVKRSLGSGFLF